MIYILQLPIISIPYKYIKLSNSSRPEFIRKNKQISGAIDFSS